MGLIDPFKRLKPRARIETASGQEVPLGEHLISLSITDNAGFEADELTLELENTNYKLVRPPRGEKLTVYLGYEAQGLEHLGSFTVKSTKVGGPRSTLNITASSAVLQEGLKEQRTQSYHQQTVGAIVKVIAGRHGLKPAVETSLEGVVIVHVDQSNESDLNFLTRLAMRFGAVFSIKEEILLFKKRATGKSVSGQPLPEVLTEGVEFSNWTHSFEDREQYKMIIAEYCNLKKGKREQVKVGKGGKPEKKLKPVYSTKEEAKQAAQGVYERSCQSDGKFEGTLVGNPLLKAEIVLKLGEGFAPDLTGTSWVCERVTHNLSSAGYTTAVSCCSSQKYAEKIREEEQKKRGS